MPIGKEPSYGWRFVAPILIGPVLNPINSGMIAIALVPISTDLGVSTSMVVWLVAGLYLASAIAQPTMGKLADVVGPRRIYLFGLIVVAMAGLLPVLWHTFEGVLLSRILIGVGTSAAYPAAVALIHDQAERQGRAAPASLISALSIAAQATIAIGPVIGGFLVSWAGWESIFLVNVPLALVAAVMTALWVPTDATRPSPRRPKHGVLAEIDVIGIIIFALALSALLFFLLDMHWTTIWMLGFFIVGTAVLFLWERDRETPFIDVRMLRRNAALRRTYVRLLLSYFGAYTMMYGFSQWVQGSAGFDALQAGLIQMPSALFAMFAGIVIARMIDVRRPLIWVGVLFAIGGVGLVFLHATSPAWALVLTAVLFGIPQGLAAVANQQAAYRQAPPREVGTALGLSRTAIFLGSIFSSAAIGIVFPDSPDDPGLHELGIAVAVVALVLLAFTLVDRSLRAGDES